MARTIGIIAGLAVAAVLVILAVIGAGSLFNSKGEAAQTATPTPVSIDPRPAVTPTPASIDPRPAATPRQTPKPKPEPTIVDLDEQRAKIEAREERKRRVNANRAANLNRRAASNANAVYQVPWPPPYDRQGRRLRAICKDGTLSYWQGHPDWTCGLSGGVSRWYW